MSSEAPRQLDQVYLKASGNVIRDTIRPLFLQLKGALEREEKMRKEEDELGEDRSGEIRESIEQQKLSLDKIDTAIASLRTVARQEKVSRRTEALVVELIDALQDIPMSGAGEVVTTHDFDYQRAEALLKAHGIEPVVYGHDDH